MAQVNSFVRGVTLLGVALLFSNVRIPVLAQGTWSVISLSTNPAAVQVPQSIVTDAQGNLYVADTGLHRISKRDAAGNWSVLAGEGTAPGQVEAPMDLAVDPQGDLFVAESSPNFRIQKRDAQGNWTVLTTLYQVGSPQAENPGQVSLTLSQIAADAAGNLYVLETGTIARIQKRDPSGAWTVLATFGQGTGQIYNPSSMTVDALGNIYVVDGQLTPTTTFRLQKRDLAGQWSVLPYLNSVPRPLDLFPRMVIDSSGNLYISDLKGILKRDSGGAWTTLGTVEEGGPLSPNDDTADLTVDSFGNLYAAEVGTFPLVERRDAQGNWTTLASPSSIGAGQFQTIQSLAVSSEGILYVAEGPPPGQRIDIRSPNGNWSYLAAPSPMTHVAGQPDSLAVDAQGNLYVETYAGIEKWDAQRTVTIVDNPGTGLTPFHSESLAVDGAGNLFSATSYNLAHAGIMGNALRKRTPDGTWVILTDPVTPNNISLSRYLAADAVGNLYVSQPGDGIRVMNLEGQWISLAGEGSALGQVNVAQGLAVDSAGNLYVADTGNDRIQKRDTAGHWTVLASSGAGIGQVKAPNAVAVDGAGNLYVADNGNHRVQEYAVASAPPAVPGDLNADGKLDLFDARELLLAAVGIVPMTPALIAGGDLNGDGQLNIMDVRLMLMRIVGLS